MAHACTLVDVRVAGGWDEVKQSVNSVVAEPRVTLDARLLGKNIIVLPLKVVDDLLEAEA